MSRSSWRRRLERARELEAEHPAAAEVLRFYRGIAEFQQGQTTQDDRLPHLLALVRRAGPAALAEAAEALARGSTSLNADNPAHGFFVRVLEQPDFERRAQLGNVDTGRVQSRCPFCAEKPLAAVLRPEGEGGKRRLLCGRCFTEWDFRRLLCPNCGEEDRDKLPVYMAVEFPHVRVEACDTCKHYIKSIDLTRNGLAVPEVDELAALSLDIWAAEHGYTKVQANLMGV